ncbi:MAG: phosphosulfolactate synthase [Myxococcaceae bacterium]|nr:phosphosulfolactate synthase [Myxococcaceae bacterium]
MSRDPWEGVLLGDEQRSRRAVRPRETGLTMLIDTGLGMGETADLLETAGSYIDLWKLSFGTSVFIPRNVLEKKLALIEQHGIDTMPGGTLFEAAIIRQRCHVYMERAAELGFTAVEISDGTITLPAHRRKLTIRCACDAGLIPITEVGKKDPKAQPSATQLAEEALRDLEWGAKAVIIEGRESGKDVGIYDDAGNPDGEAIETIARLMGGSVDRLIWEAPLKAQQAALIVRFGLDVGLGNIDPRSVLALEALRVGLRFETLQPIAEELRRNGRWTPEAVEASFTRADGRHDGR